MVKVPSLYMVKTLQPKAKTKLADVHQSVSPKPFYSMSVVSSLNRTGCCRQEFIQCMLQSVSLVKIVGHNLLHKQPHVGISIYTVSRTLT